MVEKRPGKIRHKPSEALLRGQNDRRLNIRTFNKCPYTNRKLQAAWERGWIIVDELSGLNDMSTIEEQLRSEIAGLKAKLANYEDALALLDGAPVPKVPSHAELDKWAAKNPAVNFPKSMSVNDALLQALANGPLPRKAILPAIESLRPGTTGQTVSSALNGLQKAKKVRLKNGVWSAL